MQKKLLSVLEVSDWLGIRPATLYYWVYIKKLEYVKVGSLIKFKPEVVESFIRAQTVQIQE